MNRLTLLLTCMCLMICSYAQSSVKDAALENEASAVAKDLKLDNKSEHLIYNVLYHVKTRVGDIPLGSANYGRLLKYIDEERAEMMKVILPAAKYKEYVKLYGEKAKEEMQEYLAVNNDYVAQFGVTPESVENVSGLISAPISEEPDQTNE